VRFPSVRRRFTLIVIFTVAASTGILSVTTYTLVKAGRQASSAERAADEAGVQVRIARDRWAEEGRAASIARLMAHYERRRSADAVVVHGDMAWESLAGLDGAIRARQIDPDGSRMMTGGTRYLVLRDTLPDGAIAYFFFSEERLRGDLSQLARLLFFCSIALTLAGAAVGRLIARQALRPLERASRAAERIASGDLLARLPEVPRDEFGRMAMAFNAMADAVSKQMAALEAARTREENFAADFSHELRTPLAAVTNDAALLAEFAAEMPPDARRVSQLLLRDVARLRSLSDEIIQLRQASEPDRSDELRVIELRPLVCEIVEDHLDTDQDVEVRVPPDVTLRGDPRRLRTILTNLVSNAVQHGGDSIEVRADDTDEGVSIQVVDSGPGISEDALPHVFARFYQENPSRSSAGTGLGLAIAAETAEGGGMTLSVDSQKGRGCCFTLTVPTQAGASST